MPTAIFFGGRRINIPGAYSEIDASALAGLSPGAVGIVALLGTAEGGKPLTIDPEFADATRPEAILKRYRAGNLRIAGQFAFEPSNDDAIPGGAQRIVGVKVNPATQSGATLPDANGADSSVLTSKDWGQFTEQISIEVAAGTLQGKKYTLVFEGTTEEFDNIGGDAILDLLYTPGTDGYDTALAALGNTDLEVNVTKAETGLIAERAADIAAPGVVNVVSSNGIDGTQSISVFGLLAGVAVKEVIALNGTVNVQGTQIFDKVLAVSLDAAAAGTVTVSNFPVTTTLFTVAPAVLTRGLVLTTNTPTASQLTVSIDVDTGTGVVVRGLDPNGAEVAEFFNMTTGATSPVSGAVTFAKITQIELGDVAGARTITISAEAMDISFSVFPTVQKVVDRINTLDGFTANPLASGAESFLMTNADCTAAPANPPVSVLQATKEFFANLFAMLETITNGSALANAARASGACLPPANTAGPIFLQGGSEGVTTIAEWQAALNLLKKRRVNIIVPLTSDAAVHQLLASHLILRAGQLRSEANGYVGLGTVSDLADTRSNIKARIQTLGTRHVSAIGQEPRRFHPDTGSNDFFPPFMYAAIAGGMQAGSPIGEPLTHKRPAVTDQRQDASWTTEDDSEELIDAGLMFFERVDGIGIRCVRSITTHLADDNVVFSEMSANESGNTAVFEFRRQMEQRIGQRGLSGSLASIKGLAQDTLERLVDDEIIVAFRSLQVEQIGDVYPISVEMAPVLPINFIPITVHLVAVRAAA